jgi:predicted PurR-regulated permease PerM
LERDPLVRGLLLMLAAIGSVWLAGWVWQVVSQFADVLLLFFLAWLLAFVLNPLARRLGRMGVPRLLGVALVYLMLALGLVTIGRTSCTSVSFSVDCPKRSSRRSIETRSPVPRRSEPPPSPAR